MASSTTSFTSTSNGSAIFVRRGESITYSASGGATATLKLEKSTDAGASWRPVLVKAGNVTATTIQNGDKDAFYRWQCISYTSGTATANVKNATDAISGTGSASDTSITAYEYGDIAKRTVLECNNLPITISDDAGVAQYGGA